MSRLIDADATIPMIKYATTDNEIGVFPIKIGYDDIVKVLNAQPTVEAEPVRHGEWIYGNDFHWYTASCNKCGYQRRTDIKADRWNQWNYCPNCGAKMDEVE